MEPQPVDLNQLVTGVVRLYQPMRYAVVSA